MSDDKNSPTEQDDLVPVPYAGVVGTDFLTFAVGGGANVEAQSDYFADPQRPTGNLPGIARSNFNNKAIRQGTFVAHSLCLWVSQQIQAYIPDDGDDIHWIAEFSQALADFIMITIPPPPNLGAYLPLAGGTMTGNISFVAGISTILANNTWYYGKDTAGQARGLIVRGADDNVFINDGSATYVHINGTPLLNNNFIYSGRDTLGNTQRVIGFLSDNAVHVGGSGNIWLDSIGGSVYAAGNIAIPNNSYYYCQDTAANERAVLGINTANSLMIGSGGVGSTDIYAGGANTINLHNNTLALGQLQTNGYFYCQGGERIYIPGGNDPLQIYADNGYYARLHYVVGGTRDWSEGCLSNGHWAVADESAHVVRIEIDFNGQFHCYNNVQIDGSLNISGSVGVGNLTVYGAAQVNGGMNVYGGLTVQTGNFNVNGASGFGGGVTMYNGLNVAGGGTTMGSLTCGNFGAGGSGQINGGLTVYNGLNVASGNASVAGTLTVGGVTSIGSTQVNGNLTVTNTLQVNNWASIYNGLTIQSGNFGCAGSGQVNGGLTVYNGINIASGGGYIAGSWTSGGSMTCGNFLQVNGGAQINGGLTLYNSIYVVSGGGTINSYLNVNGTTGISGYCQINGSAVIYNGLTVASGDCNVSGNVSGASFSTGGNAYFGGLIHVGQIQVGGLAPMYDNGGNVLNISSSVQIHGSLTTDYFRSLGAVDCDHVYSYNYLHADNYLDVDGWAYLRSGIQIWGDVFQFAANFQTYGHIFPVPNGSQECGTCQHQWRNVFSYNFATESDPDKKRDIAPIPEVCLSLVNAIKPSTFKWRNAGEFDDHGQPMTEDHPYANTHWGFMQPDVMSVMNDRERKLPVFGGAYEDMGVKLLQYNELVAVLWQAVRELSSEVEALKRRA
jgi:hypothetical protein